MKNVFAAMLALAIVAASAGCASTSPREQFAKDEAKAAVVRADAEKDLRAQEQKRAEDMIKSVPAWSLEPPRPDATGVYGIGIADSDKLTIALRKAVLEGEFGLAKIYNQEISGSERSYAQDNGKHGVTEQFTGLIDKLVSQVPLVGIEIVKQEVKPIDGKYTAFVMIKLPYDQFNKVLQMQRANTKDATIAAAFDDLERRLDKRRKQRVEEQQQTQAQVQAKVSEDRRSVSVTDIAPVAPSASAPAAAAPAASTAKSDQSTASPSSL